MAIQIKQECSDTELDAVKKLADSHTKELGWLPRPAFEEARKHSCILIATDSGTIVGYLKFQLRKDYIITLSQICVEPTNRQSGTGLALINKLIQIGTDSGVKFIQLKCPVDLPANNFYQHCDFELVGIEKGKKRQLNVWRKYIQYHLFK